VDNLLLGLVAIIVGGLVAAYGARGFFLLVPLFGFVLGFLLGGQVVSAILGEGLFATALGWALGVIAGLAFGVLAGLWWWAAIVILFGVVGYEIGSGLLIAVGLDAGLITLLAGLAVGIVLAGAAIVLDAPTLFVVAVTAFGGAAYAIAGAYLVLGQITVGQLEDGPIGALEGHPLGLVAWVVVGMVALGFQYVDTRRIGFELIERGRYRYG
jgi:hypothetical protein